VREECQQPRASGFNSARTALPARIVSPEHYAREALGLGGSNLWTGTHAYRSGRFLRVAAKFKPGVASPSVLICPLLSDPSFILAWPTKEALNRRQEAGQRLRRWLQRVTGLPMRRRTIRTTRIGGRTDTAEKAPEVYLANLQTVVGYVLKSAALNAAERLGLDRRQPGGRIIGKRVGWSANLARRGGSSQERAFEVGERYELATGFAEALDGADRDLDRVCGVDGCPGS